MSIPSGPPSSSDQKTVNLITRANESLLTKYTLPKLEEWKHQINEPDFEAFCASFVPSYSFSFQSNCVFIKQKSREWLDAREKLLTCSNFGIITGTNTYEKPRDFLKKWVWNLPNQSNPAMQWGTDHEPIARDQYCQFVQQSEIKRKLFSDRPLYDLSNEAKKCIQKFALQTNLERLINEVYRHDRSYAHNEVEVFELGLCIDELRPWCGGSPDGIICQYDGNLERFVVIGLLEIKCPARKVFYKDKYGKDCIPKYYNDQIQGFMNMFHIPWCHFVTWIPNDVTPNNMKIEFVKQDQVYWTTILLPALEEFYYGRCLPGKVLRAKGLLEKGYLEPIQEYECV
jgi:hypothetical protein